MVLTYVYEIYGSFFRSSRTSECVIGVEAFFFIVSDRNYKLDGLQRIVRMHTTNAFISLKTFISIVLY
jgi:hypothetical protein